MRAVLDTSVLVAAARSRNGASFQVLSMLPRPTFAMALTVALQVQALKPAEFLNLLRSPK